eukprot:5697952-Amphidinium_carterae.1
MKVIWVSEALRISDVQRSHCELFQCKLNILPCRIYRQVPEFTTTPKPGYSTSRRSQQPNGRIEQHVQ